LLDLNIWRSTNSPVMFESVQNGHISFAFMHWKCIKIAAC